MMNPGLGIVLEIVGSFCFVLFPICPPERVFGVLQSNMFFDIFLFSMLCFGCGARNVFCYNLGSVLSLPVGYDAENTHQIAA